MIQWLFLDRVHAETRRAAITDQPDFFVQTLTHVAQPALPLAHAAMARTQVALHLPVPERVPILRRDDLRIAVHVFINGLFRPLSQG